MSHDARTPVRIQLDGPMSWGSTSRLIDVRNASAGVTVSATVPRLTVMSSGSMAF
jgi:hypothetical protein